MSVYYAPAAAHQKLVAAALDAIQATHYYREEDPHADASREYAEEQLALAARNLARAVDTLPADEQPIGWTAE
ncbi:hypothetical protein ACFY9R_29170 [Streptomyces albidoflavus]|nr:MULTISPECIES: hypothetical protein [Streptomyces]MCX4444766.1 hypothetical protein [Streptomyces albidoflavus]